MEIETELQHHIGAQLPARSVDALIAALAARQHGVVARDQLIELGLGRGAIRHRLANGRLHVLHRGVYAVGHTVPRREGFWLAAVLAAGPGAVLSHRSATALWGIRPGAPPRVEVAAPTQRKRPEVRTRHTVLLPDEVTEERGIPVTNPARTLLDLAGVLTPQRLERAIEEAEYLRLTSPVSLDDLATRHQGRRGTSALRTILHRRRIGDHRTRTDFEADFLAALDAHGLPRPDRTNVTIAGHEVDAVWHGRRLIVELDSRQAHGTRRAFEDDRARDRTLQAHGYRVARITFRQLHERPQAIAADLEALLAPANRT